jgi:hypothetical protein
MLYISILIVKHMKKITSEREEALKQKAVGETEKWEKTYPNIRSIHSCKWADTYSLSRAILCLCTKSTGFSAQAGSLTVSGNTKVNDKQELQYACKYTTMSSDKLFVENLMTIPSFSPNCVVPKSIEFSFVRTSGR